MRYLLLLLALVSGPLASAQTPGSRPWPDSLAAASASPDTVAAIHRLFKGRRHRRNIIAGSLGMGLLIGAMGTASEKQYSGYSGHYSIFGGMGGSSSTTVGNEAEPSVIWLLLTIPAGPLIAADYLIYARYSRQKETEAVAAFTDHRLPAKLRRKLKPRYFN
ncbi:MAG: hypothetical protein ACRYFX_07225 [Janthinobacterium lividum]